MPAGFGNPAAYNLPTSFSGTFQQPLPGQAPFPQPQGYPPQPNGACLCLCVSVHVWIILHTRTRFLSNFLHLCHPLLSLFLSLPRSLLFPSHPSLPLLPLAGFAAFGQAKSVVTPFGQALAGPGVSSNPFLVSRVDQLWLCSLGVSADQTLPLSVSLLQAGAPTGQYPAGNSSTNPFL